MENRRATLCTEHCSALKPSLRLPWWAPVERRWWLKGIILHFLFLYTVYTTKRLPNYCHLKLGGVLLIHWVFAVLGMPPDVPRRGVRGVHVLRRESVRPTAGRLDGVGGVEQMLKELRRGTCFKVMSISDTFQRSQLKSSVWNAYCESKMKSTLLKVIFKHLVSAQPPRPSFPQCKTLCSWKSCPVKVQELSFKLNMETIWTRLLFDPKFRSSFKTELVIICSRISFLECMLVHPRNETF